ncbi:MAG: GNAT family N-acetyltransferase [Anaerolineae bacterium]|nr:GNAT family N-acetyltransferase [Anaerolineae bacterium]
MKASLRPYQPYQDTPRVSAFLERTCPAADRIPNWLRARWEYAVYSVQDGMEENLAPTGIWQAGQAIVGMVHFEGSLGEAFFQVDPAYTHLKAEMLRYAETALPHVEDGTKKLTLYIHDFDDDLEALARAAGYRQATGEPQVMARFDIDEPFPAILLPEGFTFTDRARDNDLRAINRVLWRGFNHDGPPPEQYVAGRAGVEKAPLYRPELVVMVQAPGGHLVSYCGIWYEPHTKTAYVEPVATDPDYRRKGLGKAAVLETIRRAKTLGAARALVGSGLAFYRAVGFYPIFITYPWHKEWDSG